MGKSALIFSELNKLYFLSHIFPFFFPYTQLHFTNFGDKVISMQLVEEFFH